MTRQSYAPEIRIIRLMCTGRVDLAFVVRAYQQGADGVIIGGCWPGECHYVTEGNYDALGNMYLLKKLMEHVGIDPGRLRLEWIAASEGMRFAEVMDDFSKKLGELGPLGDFRIKLQAVAKLVPYLKLVEREKRVIHPETTFQRVILQCLERGTLQNQLFDKPESITHKTMRAVFGGFLKLTPVKRALMSDMLRSTFLATMGTGIKVLGKGYIHEC